MFRWFVGVGRRSSRFARGAAEAGAGGARASPRFAPPPRALRRAPPGTPPGTPLRTPHRAPRPRAAHQRAGGRDTASRQ